MQYFGKVPRKKQDRVMGNIPNILQQAEIKHENHIEVKENNVSNPLYFKHTQIILSVFFYYYKLLYILILIKKSFFFVPLE